MEELRTRMAYGKVHKHGPYTWRNTKRDALVGDIRDTNVRRHRTRGVEPSRMTPEKQQLTQNSQFHKHPEPKSMVRRTAGCGRYDYTAV